MAGVKQNARQVNIRVRGADYRRIASAARRERATVAGFGRTAALDRAALGPPNAQGAPGVPPWPLSLLRVLFPRGGRAGRA